MKTKTNEPWNPEINVQGICHIQDDGSDVVVCTPDGALRFFPSTDRGRDLSKEYAQEWFEKRTKVNQLGVGKIVYSDRIAGSKYGSEIVVKDLTPVFAEEGNK